MNDEELKQMGMFEENFMFKNVPKSARKIFNFKENKELEETMR